MVSLGSQQPFAGVNFGLDNSFAAQSQQAQQALDLTDAQYKLISQLQDPSTSLAYQQKAATAGANVPQMRFGGNDFAEGLGNGINNFFAMKGYNQQQQLYKDIATQQHVYQQQQLQMAQQQIQAQQQRRLRAGKVLPEGMRDIYSALDPAGQDKLVADTAGKQLGVTYTPIEGTAAGQAQVNKGQAINSAIAGMSPVETNGIPIPGQVDARRNIQGFAPTTTVDVNKGVIDNQKSMVDLKKGQNELSVQPTQLQQDVTLKGLDIAIKGVEAQFAEQEKQLKIMREQLAHKQGSLDYQKGLEEYKRFDQGRQLFAQLQESGALNNNNPAKQAEIQAQLGMFGIKYNPPSSSFQTIKKKDGTVYMLDKNSGQIGKLEKDGTVKTWQDLQL